MLLVLMLYLSLSLLSLYYIICYCYYNLNYYYYTVIIFIIIISNNNNNYYYHHRYNNNNYYYIYYYYSYYKKMILLHGIATFQFCTITFDTIDASIMVLIHWYFLLRIKYVLFSDAYPFPRSFSFSQIISDYFPIFPISDRKIPMLFGK